MGPQYKPHYRLPYQNSAQTVGLALLQKYVLILSANATKDMTHYAVPMKKHWVNPNHQNSCTKEKDCLRSYETLYNGCNA